MADTNTARSQYESVGRVATYLEMEWSDWLFNGQNFSEIQIEREKRSPEIPVTPRFYNDVVEFASHYIAPLVHPVKLCDVGGATGRLVFEWLKRFPKTEEVFLAEPSHVFNQWSKKLLLDSEDIEWIPVVNAHERPAWTKPKGFPPKIASFSAAKVFIEAVGSDSVPRPEGSFSIVTCLNVADRVPRPRKLITELWRLLQNNGILVLASPMDWQHSSNVPEDQWFENLQELLGSQWKILGEQDVRYEVRLTKRRSVHYLSQVIVAQKLPL